MGAAAALLALLGCAQGPQGWQAEAADRTAYLEAATQTAQPAQAQAQAHCLSISAPDLQGECLLFLAEGLARQGEPASATCAAIRFPDWRQLCFLEVADAAGLVGEDALPVCLRAGRWRERCLAHALAHHVGQVEPDYGPGQEAALMQWAQQQTVVYGLDALSTRPYAREFTATVLAQRIHVEPGRPFFFERTGCGDLPDDDCVLVYRELVRRAMGDRQRLEAACSCPVDPARVQQTGLPTWDAASEVLALQAWGELCRCGD